MKYEKLCELLVALSLFLCPMTASAQENMDPDNNGSQYAWGENVGWLNFEPGGNGGPGVEVGDSGLTGYIWGENIGWVSLSCGNTASCGTVDFGVANNGVGNLSGYGWAENVGWVSFSCENTGSCGTVDYGVDIDPVTGCFSGHAWGENIGWIYFTLAGQPDSEVKTSWTAAPCNDNDGDGYGDPASPTCTHPLWDCDDGDPDVNPGADEVCYNGLDDDCDLNTDSICQIVNVPSGAISTIQAGLDLVEPSGTVRVSPGTYVENIVFNDDATMQAVSGPSDTVIDGDRVGPAISLSNADAVIDGFTVTNGYRNMMHGGGIFCDYSSLIITRCIIEGNQAVDGLGGGIFCYYSPLTISVCTITGNDTNMGGGGIACYNSPLTITGCIISANRGGDVGGGVLLQSDPGVVDQFIISSCMIVSNDAGYGGGIGASVDGYTFITNCTFSENTAAYWGGGIVGDEKMTVTNSILWNDWPDEIYSFSTLPTVNYSDVKNGWTGNENMDQDPLFVGPVTGDFHLQTGISPSPCINEGDNNAPNLPATDFEGHDRIIEATVDMGADEAQSPTLIELEYFDAVGQDSSVLIQWGTASEVDTEGFNILRSTEEDGEYAQINEAIIPAEGGLLSGADYEYVDNDVENGTTYWYKLEDVNIHGNGTLHGPVAATPLMQPWAAAEAHASTLVKGAGEGSAVANSLMMIVPGMAFLFVLKGRQRRRKGGGM